jgi:hypothetical protein
MADQSRPATLEDLKRLARALESAGAQYLLIGGYALLAHGYPRATVDIDLLVPQRPAAAEPLRRALMVLPDRSAAGIEAAWFEEGEGIRIADEIVVDLIFRTCGETFDTLAPFAQVIELDGVPLRTVNLAGLLKTKQSQRDRDVQDRAVIERAIAFRKG